MVADIKLHYSQQVAWMLYLAVTMALHLIASKLWQCRGNDWKPQNRPALHAEGCTISCEKIRTCTVVGLCARICDSRRASMRWRNFLSRIISGTLMITKQCSKKFANTAESNMTQARLSSSAPTKRIFSQPRLPLIMLMQGKYEPARLRLWELGDRTTPDFQ